MNVTDPTPVFSVPSPMQASPTVGEKDATDMTAIDPWFVASLSYEHLVRPPTSQKVKSNVAVAVEVTVIVSEPDAAVYWPHHISVSWLTSELPVSEKDVAGEALSVTVLTF
jgi:hypothetical protein